MVSVLNPKKIIIRMPNWLGDFVMAMAALEPLRERFPEAKIAAMCLEPLGELVLGNPSVDEVFSFKKNKRALALQALRAGAYDLGILFTNSFSSAWMFYQGKVKYRLGYKKDLRGVLLSYGAYFPKEQQHLVLTYQQLLKPLGIERSFCGPKMFLGDEEVERAWLLLKNYGIEKHHHVVGINPGAAYGSAKCWLPERFVEVTRKILASDPNIYVVFFGDNKTKPLVDSICLEFSSQVINLAGKTTLRELAALIKICRVFLTNDSGPMHIADALGTALLALFGSTSPVITGPFHQRNVLMKKVSCSPCYKRVCPIDFRCMKQLASDEVFFALKKILDQESNV